MIQTTDSDGGIARVLGAMRTTTDRLWAMIEDEASFKMLEALVEGHGIPFFGEDEAVRHFWMRVDPYWQSPIVRTEQRRVYSQMMREDTPSKARHVRLMVRIFFLLARCPDITDEHLDRFVKEQNLATCPEVYAHPRVTAALWRKWLMIDGDAWLHLLPLDDRWPSVYLVQRLQVTHPWEIENIRLGLVEFFSKFSSQYLMDNFEQIYPTLKSLHPLGTGGTLEDRYIDAMVRGLDVRGWAHLAAPIKPGYRAMLFERLKGIRSTISSPEPSAGER